MKNFIYYIKQLFPFTYWTKYKTPDNNKCHIAIWRQWFGKPFSPLHFEVVNISSESFTQTLTDEVFTQYVGAKNTAPTDKQKQGQKKREAINEIVSVLSKNKFTIAEAKEVLYHSEKALGKQQITSFS